MCLSISNIHKKAIFEVEDFLLLYGTLLSLAFVEYALLSCNFILAFHEKLLCIFEYD